MRKGLNQLASGLALTATLMIGSQAVARESQYESTLRDGEKNTSDMVADLRKRFVTILNRDEKEHFSKFSPKKGTIVISKLNDKCEPSKIDRKIKSLLLSTHEKTLLRGIISINFVEGNKRFLNHSSIQVQVDGANAEHKESCLGGQKIKKMKEEWDKGKNERFLKAWQKDHDESVKR